MVLTSPQPLEPFNHKRKGAMLNFQLIRRMLFRLGVMATLLSLGLVIGSYLRPVKSANYLQQAWDADPWISWGMGSAMIAMIFCSFGRSWQRRISVAASTALFFVWIVFASSNF